VITGVAATANSFTVNWSTVPAAYSYTVQYSQDPTFATNSQTGIVNAPLKSYTVTGREADTQYYVRVKSYPNLPGDDTASDYSASQSIRTLSSSTTTIPPGDGNVVNSFHTWLLMLQSMTQSFYGELPQLENTVLTPRERRRLLGSGVRRYGFIDKVSDTALVYSQFCPAYVFDSEALKGMMREIEVFRNILIWLRYMDRVVTDLLLLKGNEAFRMANAYYTSVRAAARNNVPEAMQVFQMLESYWNLRRRNPNGNGNLEPTQKKAISNAKAIQRGKKRGMVVFKNEGDTVIKGKKTTTVETEPNTPKVVLKETVTEKVE
jgi:hypothetical protein